VRTRADRQPRQSGRPRRRGEPGPARRPPRCRRRGGAHPSGRNRQHHIRHRSALGRPGPVRDGL
ncbi:MAG: hypothetical protein AVDCRST_MAG17-1990, partial [uncultured Solirubrobacterales bacterium]